MERRDVLGTLAGDVVVVVNMAAEQKQSMGRVGGKEEKVEWALMNFWKQSYLISGFSNTGSLLLIYMRRGSKKLKVLFVPSFRYDNPSGPTSYKNHQRLPDNPSAQKIVRILP